MTTNIVSSFQGTLSIPLFRTPYTVPVNSSDGHSFKMMSASQTAYGGNGVADTSYPKQILRNGTFWALTTAQLNELTVGNGQLTSTETSFTVRNTMFQNRFTFVSTNGATGSGSPMLTAVCFDTVPFALSQVYSPPLDLSNQCSSTALISNCVALNGPYPGIGALIAGIGIRCLTTFYLNNSSAWYVFFGIPNFTPSFSSNAACPTFMNGSSGIQKYGSMQGVADKRGQQNVIFAASSISGVVGIWGFYYTINLLSSIPVFSGEFNLITDNATINASIAAGVNGNFYACANGWMLSLPYGDYYFTADGTQYWQLEYFAGAVGIPVPPPGLDTVDSPANGYITKFIDLNGIFWYTGSHTTTGKITQPLFSLGFNLPLNPPVLSGVPPLALPCWDPCSGVGLGIDNMPENS
jgi:hypothetical protein